MALESKIAKAMTTMDDIRDTGATNLQCSTNPTLRQDALGVTPLYLSHLICGERCEWNLAASLSVPISDVLQERAKEEMLNVTARWVVALVKYAQSFWNGSVRQLPRDPVSIEQLATVTDMPVTFTTDRAQPNNAPSLVNWRQSSQKAHGYRVSNIFAAPRAEASASVLKSVRLRAERLLAAVADSFGGTMVARHDRSPFKIDCVEARGSVLALSRAVVIIPNACGGVS